MLEELPAQTIFTDIPKVQAVHRDIALLIDAEVTHAQIVSVIKSSRVKTLSQVELFDIYQGKTYRLVRNQWLTVSLSNLLKIQ